MVPKVCGEKHNLDKPLEDSSMTYDEEQYLSFWMSKLEQQIKGLVKIVYFDNLQGEFERRMGNLEKNIKDLAILIHNPKKNILKSDDVA